MSFLDSLAAYKKKSADATTAANNPPPVKRTYNNPNHDKLLKIYNDHLERNSTQNANDEHGNGLTLMFMIIDSLPFENIWKTWLNNATLATRSIVRIIIHAKHPDRVKSQWVKSRLCQSFQLKPEWGSVELTDVMVRLLNEAVYGSIHIHSPSPGTNFEKSDENENEYTTSSAVEDNSKSANSSSRNRSSHYVYLSETCLPIADLATTLQEIGVTAVDEESSSSSSSSRNTSNKQQSWIRYSNKATNGYAQQVCIIVFSSVPIFLLFNLLSR